MRCLNRTAGEVHQPGALPQLTGTLCPPPPLPEDPDWDHAEVSHLDGHQTRPQTKNFSFGDQGCAFLLTRASNIESSLWSSAEQMVQERSGHCPSPPPLRGTLSPQPCHCHCARAGPTNPSSSEDRDDGSLYPEAVFLCAHHTVCEDTRSPPRFHAHLHPRLVGTAPLST